jgi:UDP-N-acetylmuramoyl-tripeptide--D-alanyl-D-alanine ligase
MSLDVVRAAADARGVRLVAVLADMKELGAESAEAHADVGAHAAARANGGAVFVGPEMRAAFEAAGAAGDSDRFVHVADAADAVAPARRLAQPGDIVLVKGSRSMTTERVVAALTTEDAS